jgi:hypothetical protein
MHPHRRPSNVDDARAGMALLPGAVEAAERKYASRRLCISASVLGAGVRGMLKAVVVGVSDVSRADDGVWGVGGVGGSEGRSSAPEKVSRPSAGSYMATKVSAVWGGTSSDQRCCRWLLGGTTVLEVQSLGPEDACDVVMVSGGGVCRWAGMSKSALKNNFEKTRRCSFGPSTAGMSIRAAWGHHVGLLV